MNNMNVVVNGKPRALRREASLVALIDELGARAGRVAVMVNDAIIPRDQWGQWPVTEGDRIEILTFMGGG